jgi:hypothetical protein
MRSESRWVARWAGCNRKAAATRRTPRKCRRADIAAFDPGLRCSHAVGVEVFLTSDQEALRQWEERERKRAEFLATIDDAKASLARGEGRPLDEQSMSELAEEVKNRGRARLEAEKQSQR